MRMGHLYRLLGAVYLMIPREPSIGDLILSWLQKLYPQKHRKSSEPFDLIIANRMEPSSFKIMEFMRIHGVAQPEAQLPIQALVTELQAGRDTLAQINQGRGRDLAISNELAISELSFVAKGLCERILRAFPQVYRFGDLSDMASIQKRHAIYQIGC